MQINERKPDRSCSRYSLDHEHLSIESFDVMFDILNTEQFLIFNCSLHSESFLEHVCVQCGGPLMFLSGFHKPNIGLSVSLYCRYMCR